MDPELARRNESAPIDTRWMLHAWTCSRTPYSALSFEVMYYVRLVWNLNYRLIVWLIEGFIWLRPDRFVYKDCKYEYSLFQVGDMTKKMGYLWVYLYTWNLGWKWFQERKASYWVSLIKLSWVNCFLDRIWGKWMIESHVLIAMLKWRVVCCWVKVSGISLSNSVRHCWTYCTIIRYRNDGVGRIWI